MAIRLCKCGEIKTVQPWRCAMTYPWLCDKCAGQGRHVKPVLRVEEKASKVESKISLFHLAGPNKAGTRLT